jgi:hypothetical protein
MPLFESGVSPPSEPRTPPPYSNPWAVLYSAVVVFGLGLFIQTRTAAVVITCLRETGHPLVSCVLDRRVLFNTVSIGSERVTGVQRARFTERGVYRPGRGTNTFVVVLDTAEGERDAGRSTRPDAVAMLMVSINQRIEAGAARFEETLHADFFDWMLRFSGLFMSIGGVGLAPVSVWLWRRQTPATRDEHS